MEVENYRIRKIICQALFAQTFICCYLAILPDVKVLKSVQKSIHIHDKNWLKHNQYTWSFDPCVEFIKNALVIISTYSFGTPCTMNIRITYVRMLVHMYANGHLFSPYDNGHIFLKKYSFANMLFFGPKNASDLKYVKCRYFFLKISKKFIFFPDF